MNLAELHDFKISDALYFHKELNPAIFDGDRMNEEVRQQLLAIAADFIEHLGIRDMDVKDITISGSNAAYSYTRHSDIDLHIVVDMTQFQDDDIYRELFDAKKVVYNDKHDIYINNYEVELYVQDAHQPHISLGEYSVMFDKWNRLPRKRKANFDQLATKLKYEKLAKLAEFAIKSNNLSKIEQVWKTIKKYRQGGLDLNGEFGPENLAYKALRNNKIIQKLVDKIDELHSQRLSLPESKLLNKPTPTVTQLAHKYNLKPSQIYDQLKIGIKVELEHTKNENLAQEIALDHLSEKPDYYTRLKRANLEEGENPLVDLTPNYPNYSKLVAEFIGLNKNQRALFKIIDAQLKPGQGSTEKIEKAIALQRPISIEMSRIRNRSVVGEVVNPDITSKRYFIEPTENVRMGDFEFNARTFTGSRADFDARGIQIRAYDPRRPKGSASIGSADFIVKSDNKGNQWLESDDTEVDEDYRGVGIASMMYAFAKSLGNDIKPSPYQSQMGREMWNKWGKDAKNLAKEDMAEGASGYIPSEKEKNDPRFKTGLSVDVKPDSIKKNAKAFNFKVTRAGIPPLLRK